MHFYHYNDLPEIILCMASEGGLIATRQLYLQQGTHGVTTFIRQPTGAEAKHYQISLIIIRMRPEGPQNEGFLLRCGTCNAIVFRVDRDVWQAPPASALPRARQHPVLRRRRRRLQRRAQDLRQLRRRAAAVPVRADGLAALRPVRRAGQPCARRHRDRLAERDVMPIERKKTLNVFRDARSAWGSYDDFPVGQPGTDPMPHLSRSRVTQPFYLVSEADEVLIQMAGRGEIRFRDIEPAVMLLEPGDTVYIPACVPSRLIPYGENVQVRLKAEPAVREAVAWYCDCGARVASTEIAPGVVQDSYLAAVQAFNAGVRACPACARVHPPAELGDIAWAEVAAAVRASLGQYR